MKKKKKQNCFIYTWTIWNSRISVNKVPKIMKINIKKDRDSWRSIWNQCRLHGLMKIFTRLHDLRSLPSVCMCFMTLDQCQGCVRVCVCVLPKCYCDPFRVATVSSYNWYFLLVFMCGLFAPCLLFLCSCFMN